MLWPQIRVGIEQLLTQSLVHLPFFCLLFLLRMSCLVRNNHERRVSNFSHQNISLHSLARREEDPTRVTSDSQLLVNSFISSPFATASYIFTLLIFTLGTLVVGHGVHQTAYIFSSTGTGDQRWRNYLIVIMLSSSTGIVARCFLDLF